MEGGGAVCGDGAARAPGASPGPGSCGLGISRLVIVAARLPRALVPSAGPSHAGTTSKGACARPAGHRLEARASPQRQGPSPGSARGAWRGTLRRRLWTRGPPGTLPPPRLPSRPRRRRPRDSPRALATTWKLGIGLRLHAAGGVLGSPRPATALIRVTAREPSRRAQGAPARPLHPPRRLCPGFGGVSALPPHPAGSGSPGGGGGARAGPRAM